MELSPHSRLKSSTHSPLWITLRLYSNSVFIMSSLNYALITALCLPLLKLAQAQIFTVNCQPLSVHRGDPIVSPGQISAHVHAIIGGTAFQQTMGLDTAVNARGTTCDKKIDKSNYWQPQLYHLNHDGKYEIVRFEGSVSTQDRKWR